MTDTTLQARHLDGFEASELWLQCRSNPPVDLDNKQLRLLSYCLVTVLQQSLQLFQQRLHGDYLRAKVPV